jgi:hypothetical protein
MFVLRAVIVLAPMGLVVFIFYNFYLKRQFKRPEVNYIKNMRLIQMIMGQTHEIIAMAY